MTSHRQMRAHPASRVRAWIHARAHRGERGQALVLLALLTTVMVGAAGLAIDGGRLYVNRTNAQRTTDAAALAGAQTVLHNQEKGIADAKAYAAANGDPNAKVTVLSIVRAHDAVQVTSTWTSKAGFLRLLGITSGTVSASSTAQVGPAGGAVGIIPWAVNDDAFTASGGYGSYVGLQPAQSGGGSGAFNFVSITPPGGQSYADAIKNGVTSPILIGTKYPTNTFDGSAISPATADALNARIAAAPSETYASFAVGSPRVLFVPVIGGDIPNAPDPVVPTAFRAFFIERVDVPNNAIWGRFVQATIPQGTIGDINTPDKGVYVVKLIK
ncbi:MAG: Tad domain-containing protein [Chloroflexota bacterium]|nr:Tad domain-containing protein [Chloroflexota bacterium]